MLSLAANAIEIELKFKNISTVDRQEHSVHTDISSRPYARGRFVRDDAFDCCRPVLQHVKIGATSKK